MREEGEKVRFPTKLIRTFCGCGRGSHAGSKEARLGGLETKRGETAGGMRWVRPKAQ